MKGGEACGPKHGYALVEECVDKTMESVVKY